MRERLSLDLSLPWGECHGTIEINKQTSTSFKGTIVVPEGAQPPCHAASFELRGTLRRVHNQAADKWDVETTSDIEPLLGCSFVSEALGNYHPTYRGSGSIDTERNLSFGFFAIYQCPTGRWRISAGAHGAYVHGSP